MGGWAARKALRVVEHVELGKLVNKKTFSYLALISSNLSNLRILHNCKVFYQGGHLYV